MVPFLKHWEAIMDARIALSLAITTMMVPVAGYAADAQIGTVAGGSNALVARDGKVIPVSSGMPLYAGDRLITRAGGSANVRMANNCAVTVGASAMLPMTNTTSCAKPSMVSFDEGRAGHAGSSSAFYHDHDHDTGLWLLGGAFLVGGGIALYELLEHDHHHTPVSP